MVVPCTHCGKLFRRKRSYVLRYANPFCSRVCKSIHQRGVVRPEQVTGAFYPCEECGTPTWRTPAILEAHVFCSKKCAGRAGTPRPNHPGPGLVGALNVNWRGGSEGYAPGFTRSLSRKVRERDGNECRHCGATAGLVAHHIDGGKTNHSPSNLVTLCRSCHRSLHNGTLVLA